MNWNYLNPAWILSRLLEKTGIAKTYLERVEFAAHVGWSLAVGLLGILLSIWTIPAIWTVYTFYDELVTDGWKGKDQGYDTLWDLGSKLVPSTICLILLFTVL